MDFMTENFPQILEDAKKVVLKQVRKEKHLSYRVKQIKYLKQKRQTFFYYFAAKYSKKSVFSLDKNLFI